MIAGPTAVGKTSLAIALARHYGTSIISADSRQCYKELDIGVAKPSAAQLADVQHYFINTHTITEAVTAAHFEAYALQAAASIFQQAPIAIIAGGTGLYIKAFCEGLDTIPPVPAAIRQQVIAAYENNGIGYLQSALQAQDPVFWQEAEQHNPQRLMRALEVLYTTGKSITSFRSKTKAERPFRIIKTGLALPRGQLYANINMRVDDMVAAGLEAEAKSLLPYRHLNALQTVGYQEFFQHFDGLCTLDEAVDKVKQNTRRYAKRQVTWFGRDEQIKWFAPGEADALAHYVEEQLQL